MAAAGEAAQAPMEVVAATRAPAPVLEPTGPKLKVLNGQAWV